MPAADGPQARPPIRPDAAVAVQQLLENVVLDPARPLIAASTVTDRPVAVEHGGERGTRAVAGNVRDAT
jgi:hypothetical protein